MASPSLDPSENRWWDILPVHDSIPEASLAPAALRQLNTYKSQLAQGANHGCRDLENGANMVQKLQRASASRCIGGGKPWKLHNLLICVSIVSLQECVEWLVEADIVQALLRAHLHQRQYVDQVQRVLKILAAEGGFPVGPPRAPVGPHREGGPLPLHHCTSTCQETIEHCCLLLVVCTAGHLVP